MLTRSKTTPKRSNSVVAVAVAVVSPKTNKRPAQKRDITPLTPVASNREQHAKKSRSMMSDDTDFLLCTYCDVPLEPSHLFDHVMERHLNEADPNAHRRSCGVCVLFYGGDPSAVAAHLPSHLKVQKKEKTKSVKIKM
jgi:hypothetical protein